MLFDISQLLQTGLDRKSLETLVGLTECGVNLICKAVALTMRRGPKATIEVKPAVVQAYNRRLDTIMATRPESGDCSSWYKNKEGRVTQNFPGTMTFYWWLTRTLRKSDFNVVA